MSFINTVASSLIIEKVKERSDILCRDFQYHELNDIEIDKKLNQSSFFTRELKYITELLDEAIEINEEFSSPSRKLIFLGFEVVTIIELYKQEIEKIKNKENENK